MLYIDKPKFYDAYRKQFGSLKPATVDTLEAIIDVFNQNSSLDRDTEKKAYMLATVRHECGPEMKPIIENMCYSQSRIRQVWPSRPEAVKFGFTKFKKCDPEGLANNVYSNRLGNGSPVSGDGFRYRGRGIGAQFTGKVNYEKFSKLFNVDLVNNPELALDLNLGAKILYKGCTEGLFTGVSLGKYIKSSGVDYKNARLAVNVDVGLNGNKVATLARQFEQILKASLTSMFSVTIDAEKRPVAASNSIWEGLKTLVNNIIKGKQNGQ
jgi:putative chitinase